MGGVATSCLCTAQPLRFTTGSFNTVVEVASSQKSTLNTEITGGGDQMDQSQRCLVENKITGKSENICN